VIAFQLNLGKYKLNVFRNGVEKYPGQPDKLGLTSGRKSCSFRFSLSFWSILIMIMIMTTVSYYYFMIRFGWIYTKYSSFTADLLPIVTCLICNWLERGTQHGASSGDSYPKIMPPFLLSEPHSVSDGKVPCSRNDARHGFRISLGQQLSQGWAQDPVQSAETLPLGKMFLPD
jgi:hypothetical protein